MIIDLNTGESVQRSSLMNDCLKSGRIERPNFLRLLPALWVTAGLLASVGGASAQSLLVANGSFESPTPPQGYPAWPLVDSWQKTPEPQGYDPNNFGGLTWDQMSGVFPNTAAGQPDHIDNVDGNQAAYLFTLQGVGFRQQLTDAFQIGRSYDLTLGILGGGGISAGDTFTIGFFFMSGGSLTPITSTVVTFSAADFPNATHLIDHGINLPTVQTGDAWAGQNIGISLTSTAGNGAGYWDIDNVRLTSVPEPSIVGLLAAGAVGLVVWNRRTRYSLKDGLSASSSDET